MSRGLAGFAGRTLVANLPGSSGGVRDGLAVLDELLEHLLDVHAHGGGHHRHRRRRRDRGRAGGREGEHLGAAVGGVLGARDQPGGGELVGEAMTKVGTDGRSRAMRRAVEPEEV